MRQRASELLRRVQGGESIEITDRGRPVAVLNPISPGTPLQRLRDSGDLEPATGSIDDLPEPLHLLPGQEPPSSLLARLRSDER